jgi:hypothetical protein
MPANITLFNPEPKVLYKNIYFIKSKKLRVLGTEMKGKVYGLSIKEN